VWRATSDDGLRFTLDDEPLLEQASVPDAVVTSTGDVLVVFVDASDPPETAAMVRSRDGGETFEQVDFSIEGLAPDTKVLDPNLVVLPDGRIRLYYFSSPVTQDINGDTAHVIASAISDDGIHFVAEGTVLEEVGLVDPDVFGSGDEWIMYVFGRDGTRVARSTDGRSFTATGVLALPQVGTTGPIEVDGRLRLYGFEQVPDGSLVAYESDDGGSSWVEVEGFTLELRDGTSATDPQVVRADDGTWQMYLKVQDSC
jgi:hypothetical protein